MPYLRVGRRKRTSIEETRCWSCARLELRTDGSFSCPKNRRLPKTIPHNFATKCSSYIEVRRSNTPPTSKFTNKNQPADSHFKEKPLHDTEIAYQKINKRTMLWDEQIRVMLKKGFVSRGRVRVRAPSEVKRTRSLGFDRIPSRPPRSEIPHVARVVYLPRYTWTMEDREIFSIYEMQMKGYCEECSNYGVLRYQDGLYLCANCRYLRVNL